MMFVIGDEKKATQQHTHAKNRVHILCSVSYMQQQDEAVKSVEKQEHLVWER